MEILAPNSLAIGVAHWRFQPAQDSMVVALKGTFRMEASGKAQPSEEPDPITGDLFEAEEPPRGACRYASDMAPLKPQTDLMLVGKAQLPKSKSQGSVGFAVGPHSFTLRAGAGRELDGFGPLDPYGPERMAKWPTPTEAWIERGWPWAPADLDYGYFNAAPPALQVDYLTGNEKVVCDELHPEHRRYACELPGLRPRCFVLDRRDGKPRFREVTLRLDTLWIDIDVEKLVLVWRGNLPVASRDLEEVECVYVVLEQVTEPRLTLEQHRQVFDLTREEAEAQKAPPVEPPKVELAAPPAPKKPAVIEVAPEPFPDSLKKQLLALGTPAAAIAAVERGDEAGAIAVMQKTFGIAQPDLDKLLAEQREVARKAHVAEGGDPKLFDAPPPKPKPAPPKEAAPTGWSRARVEAAKSAGVSAAGAVLEKLDLSGLDLREMDFTDAIMSGINLDGAALDGAKLDGATLNAASAVGATFEGASLTDADLTALSAKEAVFTRAKLSGALFDNAELTGAKLDEVEAGGTFFRRAKLAGASFVKADLKGAIMDGAKLERARLMGAKLDEASAEGVVADGADFSKASLEGYRGGEKSSYVGAKLCGCQAERSRWMHSNLALADFSRSKLVGADLSRSELNEATLRGVDGQGADFTNSKLERADVGGANLREAQLEGADLRRASFRGASLYQANLWLAQLDGADLDGAITTGTLLHTPVRNWAG